MKHKKYITALMALVLGITALSGCSQQKGESAPEMNDSSAEQSSLQTESLNESPQKATIQLMMIKGPTGVGAVNLMDKNEKDETQNHYEVAVAEAPKDVVAKIANGEADIAAAPTNVAATLSQKTNGNVQMLAVNTLGVLYLMENGNSIQSIADLKGKTIYSTGQGANPEYVLNYLLEKSGLTPGKDVSIQFLSQNEELATAMATGEAQIALVPEPTVTTIKTKNKDIRIALNVTDEWEKVDDSSQLMMGCVVARKDFVSENPEAVNAFLTEYQASIEAANNDLETTAALCEKYGIIPKAAVAKQAIPNCNLVFIDGKNMKNSIEGYFQVLYDANPKSIGGAMLDDSFYYEK